MDVINTAAASPGAIQRAFVYSACQSSSKSTASSGCSDRDADEFDLLTKTNAVSQAKLRGGQGGCSGEVRTAVVMFVVARRLTFSRRPMYRDDKEGGEDLERSSFLAEASARSSTMLFSVALRVTLDGDAPPLARDMVGGDFRSNRIAMASSLFTVPGDLVLRVRCTMEFPGGITEE